MIGTRMPPAVRRAVLVHTLSTLLVSIGIAGASAAVSAVLSAHAAHRDATIVTGTIAHAVAAPFASIDMGDVSAETRETVLAEIQSFIDAGIIYRAKVWKVDEDTATVLFSDEVRNEGVTRPFDPALAERLDTGEVVVFDVPDDSEHRYEFGEAGALEAFVGFDDAEGARMRLELYLPPGPARTLSDTFLTMLPVSLGGPLLLGAATLPLALRLARRLERRERERSDLLQTALAASDRERRRLAARLHDGVIQNLASVGLTLDNLEHSAVARGTEQARLLSRASTMVDEDIAQLRSLLTELAPPEFEGSLRQAVADLVDDLRGGRVDIVFTADDDIEVGPGTSALLYRAVRELLRNALEHASPGSITLSMHRRGDCLYVQVADDGSGFDTSSPAPDGHHGLRLIRQSVVDSGGEFEVESGAEGTTLRIALPVEMTTVG